jgi:hypothetical protein
VIAPAGWYDDGGGALRSRDGSVWTGHVAPAPAAAPAYAPPPALADYCDGADYSWVDAAQDWNIDVTHVDQVQATAVVTTNETNTSADTAKEVVETWSYSFKRVDDKWNYVDAQQVE